MASFHTKLGTFFLFFLLLGVVVEGFGQVLRNTNKVNDCLTEYTFGTANEDQFVIVVVTCNDTPTGTSWQPPLGLTELTEMLIVAGGGAGGKRDASGIRGAGGGGAGGVLHITDRNSMRFNVNPDDITLSPPLTISIGAGGVGRELSNQRGTNGENSFVTTTNPNFQSRTAFGGGAGGTSTGIGSNGSSSIQQPYTDQRRGDLGGSGGGSVGPWRTGAGNPPILGGEGTANQGNPGGDGIGNNQVNGGGGGGGAGGTAQEVSGNNEGGDGGPGLGIINDDFELLIFDALPLTVPRMVGGGGGGVAGNPSGVISARQIGFGGIGGGGNASGNGNGVNGLPNTGGGGGAGGATVENTFKGGDGGSGIVILRYDFLRILPVEFLYHEAQFLRQTRSTVISWATAKEWESSHFEIERATRGMNFQKIGEVDAVGWSDSVVEYKFEDSNLPLSGGNVLYRLKQVDLNGKFAYTSVMSTRVPGTEFTQGVWRAFPNPTDGSAFNIGLLDRSQYEDEPLTFRLVHPLVQTASISVNTEMEMNQQLAQHISRMPSGVFVVEIQWGRKIEHIKVMKK